jgi:hypothetical protein
MPVFRGGFNRRGSPTGIVSSSGIVSGTVVDLTSTPVSGITITLTPPVGSAQTTTTNGSGQYSFNSITPGSGYTIRQDTTLDYSIGPSESDSYSITVNAGLTTTQNFVVQPAYATGQNFQQLASTAAAKGTISGGASTFPLVAGNLWYQRWPNLSAVFWNNDAQQSLTTDWPDGSKCWRFDWPDRSGSLPSYFISTIPSTASSAGSFPAGTNSKLYFRWTDFCSLGFTPGGGGNLGGGCEYKSVFIDMCSTVVGGVTSIQIEWENRNAGAPNDNIGVRMKMIARSSADDAYSDGIFPSSNPNVQCLDYQPAQGDLLNTANTWILEITGLGTTNITATLYRSKWTGGTPSLATQIITLSSNFYGAANCYPDGQVNFQAGENMNGGPNAACYRLFREIAVYKTRPNMYGTLAG